MIEWIQILDEGMQLAIQNALHPAKLLEAIMTVFSMINEKGIIWISLGLVLLIFKKTRTCGIYLLLTLLIQLIIGEGILKHLIERPRPYNVLTDLPTYLPRLSSYSFPSGHTMSSFAAAMTITQFNKKYGIPAFVVAALIAFSRIYLFMHWVTDVLCGALLGVLVSLIVVWAVKRIHHRFNSFQR